MKKKDLKNEDMIINEKILSPPNPQKEKINLKIVQANSFLKLSMSLLEENRRLKELESPSQKTSATQRPGKI